MTRTDYATLRLHGYKAADALKFSATMARYDDALGEGTMRFRYEPDDSPDLSFLDQDCYQSDRAGRACADKVRAMAERDGVWVAIMETRCHACGNWTMRDTLGGCIGAPGFSVGADGNCLSIDYACDMIHVAEEALKQGADCGGI